MNDSERSLSACAGSLRQVQALGYRLAFAWHFAGGRSLGNFTVIAGLSHPSYIHIFFSGCDWWISLLHHRWYGKWQVKSEV